MEICPWIDDFVECNMLVVQKGFMRMKLWNKPVDREDHEDDGTENADNITSQAKASFTFKYYTPISLLLT